MATTGGGASGLAAYRHISCHASLKATLFESSPTLGGLWSSEHPYHRPNMLTNVSRHTITFSDLAWPQKPGQRNAFPRATDVGSYLRLYSERYILQEDVRLCTNVIGVEYYEGKWNVTSHNLQCIGNEAEEFDYLIIASGFFSTPYTPPLPGISDTKVFIHHSAAFTDPESYRGQNVAVVGGSLSAVEIAGILVPHAAKIHHIYPKAFFTIPQYVPTNTESGKPRFLPLDLVFNRRSMRASMVEQIHPTLDTNRKKAAHFSSTFPSPPYLVNPDDPPHIGISDYYAAGLRTGVITPHLAKLDSLDPDTSTLNLSTGNQICSVDAVIFCTGYTTLLPFLPLSLQAAISYQSHNQLIPFLTHRLVLHPDLPQAGFVGLYRGPYFAVMELQARYLAALFAGERDWPSAEVMKQGIEVEQSIRDSDVRPQFPHGDYGGLVESYAQLLGLPTASTGTSGTMGSISDIAVANQILAVNYPVDRMPEVEAIESDVLETLHFSEQGGWILAAVFRSWCGHWKIRRTIRNNMLGGMDGTFDGIATFQMRPPSNLPTDPGKLPPSNATFCPYSLDDGLNPSASSPTITNEMHEKDVLEYLYHESGTFTTSIGTSFHAHKKYIYRYTPHSDSISVWFPKGTSSSPETPARGQLDYWFHDILLESPHSPATYGAEETASGGNSSLFMEQIHKGGWTAIGTEHLCVRDLYKPFYKFCFQGAEVREFGIGYDVHGPKKGYVSEAWYERVT